MVCPSANTLRLVVEERLQKRVYAGKVFVVGSQRGKDDVVGAIDGEELPDDEKFKEWKGKAEAIVELREAQQEAIMKEKGFVEAFRDSTYDDDDMLFEDQVFESILAGSDDRYPPKGVVEVPLPLNPPGKNPVQSWTRDDGVLASQPC
uniref:Uncharacterized protein n=1 Tax=Leersia perrieri TaxID=77586 RepID=A0A0D9W975_9ORYZ